MRYCCPGNSRELTIGVLAGSLLALAAGVAGSASSIERMSHAPSGEVPFWAGFAIFFPAVTGV
ncbi:MAG: hypothetical protein ACWGPN_17325, partial [Gammaproteobacteria bacterium]